MRWLLLPFLLGAIVLCCAESKDDISKPRSNRKVENSENTDSRQGAAANEGAGGSFENITAQYRRGLIGFALKNGIKLASKASKGLGGVKKNLKIYGGLEHSKVQNIKKNQGVKQQSKLSVSAELNIDTDKMDSGDDNQTTEGFETTVPTSTAIVENSEATVAQENQPPHTLNTGTEAYAASSSKG